MWMTYETRWLNHRCHIVAKGKRCAEAVTWTSGRSHKRACIHGWASARDSKANVDHLLISW
ncbi:hypothetical protein PanWU01x14_283990, partial [Parasponia andersonii]